MFIVFGITEDLDKSLSKELKKMTEDQLVERVVYDTFPSRIDYFLTDHAKTLTGVINTLREWGL